MEEWFVVGVDTKCQLKFKDKDGDKIVSGVKWFLVGEPPYDPNRFLGKIVREQFISNERLANLNVAPKPDDYIMIYFNRYGDVAKVEILDKKTAA